MYKKIFNHQIVVSLAVLSLICAVFVFSLSNWQAQAATGTNEQINFQGRLLTDSGAVVPDGNYNIEFEIVQDGDGCNPTSGTPPCGGTVEWTETRTGSDRVRVKNGYFSVYLGSVTPFGSNVDWNQDTLWLSINIGGTGGSPSWDGEMEPFTRLGSTPYALNSKSLGGLLASDFIQLAQGSQTDASTLSSIYINKTGASGNILELEKNGSDVLVVGNSGGLTLGAGDVAVAAGQGLDTSSAGALTIGNTTATSVSICNSAACDTISIGTNTDADTISIGDSNDTLTLTGGSGSTLVLNGTTLSADELNRLDGKNALLIDQNDAIAIAITGTGDLDAGSITAGFGAISVGSDNITTTGTVQGSTSVLTGSLDAVSAGALTIGNSTATSVSICNSAACDTISIGTNTDADTINIGDSSDTLTLTGGSGSSFVLDGTTVSAAEFNILDGGLSDAEVPNALTITGGTIDSTTTIDKDPVITLGGDLSGNTTLSNLGNGTLTATIASDSVALGTDTTGNYVSSATASGGLTLTGTEGASLGIDLSSGDGAGGTSSGSGLEIDANGVGLLQGCTDGQLLKWIESTDTWDCASDTAGGVSDGDKGDITVSGSGATWTIDANSVALGTDTTGDYVASFTAGSGLTGNASGEGSTPTLAVGAGTGITVNADDIEIDTSVVATLTGAQTLTNKTLTAPRIANGGFIADANGNEALIFNTTASAVNELTITNAATGNGPTLAATGGNTNVDFSIDSKGTGALNLNNNATGNILIGGGSGSTGCTVTNSSGAFACTSTLSGSNFSGSSSGTNTGDQTITLTGDVTGSGTGSFAATIASDSVALGTDTTGNYVATITAGLGISGSGSSEGSAVTIALDTSASLSGDHTLSANEAKFGSSGLIFEGSSADASETYFAVTNPTADRTITFPNRSGTVSLSGDTFTGDVTGTLNASGATALTIATNSVALTTDTTGNYVGTITAGSGITTSGAATGEGIAHSIAVDTAVVATTTNALTMTNKTLTSPVLTTPRIADLGFIADANGNEQIILDTVTSAVNEITIANAATGNAPTLSATGGDTNVAFSINSKGTGALNLNNTATGDILLGGGSASTGCTVTNSTGAFACSAGLTGTSGTFSSTISANGGLTVAGGQTFTVNSEGFTDLTGSGLTISGNALTADSTQVAFLSNSNTFTGNSVIFRNASNGSTAFRIQTSGSSDIFVVNTSTSTVNIATLTLTNALTIANGGTGATNAADARTNLGLGSIATLNSIDYGNMTTITAFRCERDGGSAQSISNSTDTNLNCDTEVYDDGSNIDTTNDYFVAPANGVYDFSASFNFGQSLSTATLVYATIDVNSSCSSSWVENSRGSTLSPSGGGFLGVHVSASIKLSAGDCVRPEVWHNYGSARDLRTSFGEGNYFSGYRVR